MKEEQDMQREIASLQIMEQRANSLTMQKQNLQAQLLEAENAIAEIKTGDEIYKVMGGVIIKKDKDEINRELTDKIEELKSKIDNFEEEETRIREKLEKKQSEILSKLK